MIPLFRCSRLSELLTGNLGLTANQQKKLTELRDRQNGIGKPLTDNMIIELGELLAKEKESKIGDIAEGAKTFVLDTFLQNKYGYKEDVLTYEMLKGLRMESEAITLLDSVYPINGIRMKNKLVFKNDWIQGTPDLKIPEFVEDTKVSTNLRTWANAELTKKYEWQLKGYCMLLGLTRAKLHYCLLKDTDEMILEKEKQFYFKFNCDESNDDYQKACKQIKSNNDAIDLIPIEKRVRTFDIEATYEDFEKIKIAVEKSRIYYQYLETIF